MLLEEKKAPIDKLVQPLQRFIQQEKASGIVLGLSVIVALILANSGWAESYHHFWEHKLGFQWNDKTYFGFTLHHWINDGLMSVFFFVVGLELKREIIAGQLSNFKNAMMPIGSAVGGMLVPALIYLLFNPSGSQRDGWGIPMATDIAFALGVLYLLGRKVPLSLKVFLTALAIVDDLGAVLVIALFYTSDISFLHLAIGGGVLTAMYIGNRMGIRSIWFYAVLGIGGVWTEFLLSGIHATIAAVLAAFTIPADVKIKEPLFVEKLQKYLDRFKNIDPSDDIPTLSNEQLHVVEKIQTAALAATPPLQRLEHAMHPMVSFIIIPVFALANAGVSLAIDWEELFSNNIAIGVSMGLLIGKFVGVVGGALLLKKLKIARFPNGINTHNLMGAGLLASIGFTMSLFITSLAFSNAQYVAQAKIAIFATSIIGGISGYIVLNRQSKKKEKSGKPQ